MKTLIQFWFSTSHVLHFKDLKAGKDLTHIIEAAYGPSGHGILFVDGIPDYQEVRASTLPLFQKIAHLPTHVLQKYKRPNNYYSRGWEQGLEKYHERQDAVKGIYHVNCSTDDTVQISPYQRHLFTPQELKKFQGNIWIDELPEVQTYTKILSKIMIEVGVLLANQVDIYASNKIQNYKKQTLTKIVSEGNCHTGRMIHYFPFEEKGSEEDDWFRWHNDYGALTALTSPMYINEEGKQATIKIHEGGLFCRNRFQESIRVLIPPQMLAFQLGEAAQIQTGGFLEATPHCIMKSKEIAGKKISRNTFVIFMDPDKTTELNIPEGILQERVYLKHQNIPEMKHRWHNGILYKEFQSKTRSAYHQMFEKKIIFKNS